ncbi:MAG: helix-turn-helix transcriptional regulator [Rubrivivax sp.]
MPRRLLDAIERSHQPEHWAVMVPAPRLTACPGVGPQLLRWADAVSLAEAESPLLLSALAPMTHGWRALWAGRLQEAEHFLARSEGDERWVGHPPVVHSHRLAFTAVVSMALGRCDNALAAARAHGHEFPASYGGRGPWYSLNLMGRVAAACGDIALLRDALARLAQLDATLPEATPLRLQPVLGLRGHLAWLEGRPTEAAALWRQAMEHEEPCDLFGFANELRARLALQALHGLHGLHARGAQVPAAAAAREPVVAAARKPDDERALAEAAAWLRPMLAQPADGPRGALFALPVLRELAAVPWGGHLDAAAQAALRTWAAAAAEGAPDAAGAKDTTGAPVAPAAAGASVPDGGLTAREDQVLALMARGLSNKLIARELGVSPHTVKRHVAHVLDKLELASRSQAAAWYHARRQ